MAGIDANTVLMLHCDGSNGSTTFIDSGLSPKTVSANGNAAISTAQSVFGGTSALFDGSGDYLSSPSHADFAFGTGDFTVDFWLNPSSYGNDYEDYFGVGGYTNLSAWRWRSGLGGQIGVQIGASILTTTHVPSDTGVWRHIAIVRNSGTVTCYVDGISVGSMTLAGSISQNALYIGGALGSGDLEGYIDEFRVSNVARWTSNFTPPSVAYSNDGYVLAAGAAAFTLTAYSATLTPVRNLVASAASFALTANAATLRADYKLSAAGVSYSLTAFDAALRPAFKLAAAAATYTLTANTAALTRLGVLSAAAASYTLTANAATLARSYDFDADAASYTLTAYDAQLYSGQRLQAAGATFALTAYAASVYAIRFLYPAAATYTLTAFPATLRKSYLNLAAAGASFTLSAQDSRLAFDHKLVAAGASFTLDAKAAAITHGYWLNAEAAAFVLSGGEAVLSQARRRINLFPLAY